jgi:hypothetical protein
MNDRYGTQHGDPRTIDKIMWSSDFPHSSTDWPNSHETIDEVMQGVSAEGRYKMLASNAIRLFHLDDDQAGGSGFIGAVDPAEKREVHHGSQ